MNYHTNILNTTPFYTQVFADQRCLDPLICTYKLLAHIFDCGSFYVKIQCTHVTSDTSTLEVLENKDA